MKSHTMHGGMAVALAGLLMLWSNAAAAEVTANTREHLKKMDSDGDGRISATEHAAGAKSMFIAMDPDGSDTVTVEEMDAARQARKQAPAANEMTSAQRIAAIDTDQNGELSAEEHESGSRSMFQRMDTNADGFVSAEELQAGHDGMMTKKT